MFNLTTVTRSTLLNMALQDAFPWATFGRNTLWILGFALILAAFSYAAWSANQDKRPLRQVLIAPATRRASWFGVLLIAIGLALTSNTLWETLIWSLLALYTLYKAWSLR